MHKFALWSKTSWNCFIGTLQAVPVLHLSFLIGHSNSAQLLQAVPVHLFYFISNLNVSAWLNEMVPWYTDCFVVVCLYL